MRAPCGPARLGVRSRLGHVGPLERGPAVPLGIHARGYSSPASAWTDAVTAIARELGLQVRVVSQVERDVDRGEELAGRLDAELHPWQGGDHLTAETDLRRMYRQARMVSSDSLHVLIFAATEGAVPLYLPNVASAKIPRTMAVADLDGFQRMPPMSSPPWRQPCPFRAGRRMSWSGWTPRAPSWPSYRGR